MNLARPLAAPLALAAAAGLTGCFTAPIHPSGPTAIEIPPSTAPLPAPPVPQAIPDAVPRVEPRSRYGNPPFYDVFGKRYYVLSSNVAYVERGVASWYGPGFHKVRTSTGEPYDMYAMTAAHKTLPLPAYVRVTNLQNGRSIVVRVNDRGPFVGNRIIDLSYTAAAKLDMLRNGTAMVEVRSIDPSVPTHDQNAPLLAAAPVAPASGQAGAATGRTPSTGANAVALATASGTQTGTAITTNAPADAPANATTATLASASGVSSGPAATPVGVAPGSAPTIAGVAQIGTAPAATPQGPSASATTAGRQPLFVQAGAFADPANAEHLAAKLRGGRYGNIFVRDDFIAGRRMYRVRIGPVSGVPEFDRIVATLERAGVHDAHLALD